MSDDLHPHTIFVQLAGHTIALPTSAALVEHVHERLRTLYPHARVTIIFSRDLTDDRVSVVAADADAQATRIHEVLAHARERLATGA